MLGLQVYMVYLLLIWSIYDYTKADPFDTDARSGRELKDMFLLQQKYGLKGKE